MATSTLLQYPNELVPAQAALYLSRRISNFLENDKPCICGLSGGSSPKPMLQELAQQNIDWSSVVLLPVDERWTDDPRQQNISMLNKFVTQIPGHKPKLETLYKSPDLKENVERCNELASRYDQSPDIVVLGMGLDGHTASLFPDAEEYPSAMNSMDQYVLIHPTQAPFPRISMSFRWLSSAAEIVLYIPGKDKLDCFNRIRSDPDSVSPIKELEIHFANKLTIISSEG